MPRVRRRVKERRASVTTDHVHQLLTGRFWFDGFIRPGNRDGCDDEMRPVWAALRDDLLQQWIQLYPGSRPYAWWRFDAPDLRRRTDGGVHPFDDPAHVERVASIKAEYPNGLDLMKTAWGLPSCVGPDQIGVDYDSDIEYLVRLGLMSDEEREAVDAGLGAWLCPLEDRGWLNSPSLNVEIRPGGAFEIVPKDAMGQPMDPNTYTTADTSSTWK